MSGFSFCTGVIAGGSSISLDCTIFDLVQTFSIISANLFICFLAYSSDFTGNAGIEYIVNHFVTSSSIDLISARTCSHVFPCAFIPPEGSKSRLKSGSPQ